VSCANVKVAEVAMIGRSEENTGRASCVCIPWFTPAAGEH
jgi:hypothetical protein